ncbi:YggT family protein [Pseudothermotoga sp.]|uniref:YggT family protein n=1 Tax=Pseudothermotoga sp. TaxID=2033661 RepID=UPI0031F69E8C
MFVLSNLLYAVAKVLQLFIYVELLAVILSTILSWLTPFRYSVFRQFVDSVADLVLRPLRKLLPFVGPVDVSPMIAILVLVFLENFVVRTLFDLAVRLR